MLNLIVAPSQICPKSTQFTKKVVKYLKHKQVEYSVCFSSKLEDIGKNVSELLSFGETEFVLVGSDIALHEFINAVPYLDKIKFGVIPTDLKDDFANYLELSLNPIQAIKDILTKHVEEVDYIILNNFKVINNISIGALAEVMEVYNQFKIKNALTLKYALTKYGSKFNGINLTIDNKNQKVNENIFDLSISNGGLLEGKRLSALSNMKDGLFNLNYAVYNKEENKKYLSLLFNEKQIYDEKTHQLWLNSVKITNEEGKIKVFADEKFYTLDSLTLSIKEKGIKLYTAKK